MIRNIVARLRFVDHAAGGSLFTQTISPKTVRSMYLAPESALNLVLIGSNESSRGKTTQDTALILVLHFELGSTALPSSLPSRCHSLNRCWERTVYAECTTATSPCQ